MEFLAVLSVLLGAISVYQGLSKPQPEDRLKLLGELGKLLTALGFVKSVHNKFQLVVNTLRKFSEETGTSLDAGDIKHAWATVERLYATQVRKTVVERAQTAKALGWQWPGNIQVPSIIAEDVEWLKKQYPLLVDEIAAFAASFAAFDAQLSTNNLSRFGELREGMLCDAEEILASADFTIVGTVHVLQFVTDLAFQSGQK
jgi:hypothetical protein